MLLLVLFTLVVVPSIQTGNLQRKLCIGLCFGVRKRVEPCIRLICNFSRYFLLWADWWSNFCCVPLSCFSQTSLKIDLRTFVQDKVSFAVLCAEWSWFGPWSVDDLCNDLSIMQGKTIKPTGYLFLCFFFRGYYFSHSNFLHKSWQRVQLYESAANDGITNVLFSLVTSASNKCSHDVVCEVRYQFRNADNPGLAHQNSHFKRDSGTWIRGFSPARCLAWNSQPIKAD